MILTEMIDRVFGDRYRIEELIGVGAISAVYTAYDPVEGRWVALKVFDAELATDEQFVQRLITAVEEAAVLTHSNIAAIYDWGIDDGPYVVSELCEGGSLESMLASGETLAASQALVVTLECSRALKHGHDHGFIHRKLTPSNVLFSADHQVRISDYGLAEVMADAPVAQAARALENVRYASPEQARGRPVAESSDMYTLALVVNEAVSGVKPEVADTVVGTLMARAESSAELDASLAGLLPSLERCGRVEPGERPEPEELAIALLASAETMERPGTLPIAGLRAPDHAVDAELQVAGGQIVVDDLHQDLPMPQALSTETLSTEAVPVETLSTEALPVEAGGLVPVDQQDYELIEPTEVDEPVALSLVTEPLGSLENLEQAEPVFADVPGGSAPGTGVAAQLDVPERTPTKRAASNSYEQLHDDADDRLPWWPLLLLGLLLTAATAAGVYFFALDTSDDAIAVPNLIGVPFDDVASQVDDRWQISRLEGRVDGSVVGTVVSQSPVADSVLDPGGTLSVTVSLGNEMVEIPSDIVGLTVDQAVSRLGSVGLTLGRVSEEKNEGIAAGLVIGLNEPTTQKPSGQGVALRVSGGAEDRLVPNEVIGMTIGDATSLLVGLRLQAVEEPVYNPDVEAGVVLGVIPEIGSVVPADSAVTLIVSAGPEPVVMPDIIGLALDEAIDELEALGLIFIDTEGTPGEDVIGSLPPIGATVEVGTEVLIYLADPSEDDEDN